MRSNSTDGLKSFLERTWVELAAARQRDDVVLIPMGQVVEHGPHLPVSTDILQAEAVCQLSAAMLDREGYPVLVGPTIPFGTSPAQESFPGFINLGPETLTALILDISQSLSRQGFRRQVLVLFGPSSWASVQAASFHVSRDKSASLYAFGGLEATRALADGILDGHQPDKGRIDTHAGELETSLMLAIDPARVDMQKAVTHYSELQVELQKLPFIGASLPQRMMAVGLSDWSAFGEEGVSGDATLATAEKGRLLLDRVATTLAQHVVRYVLREDS